jgi:predicted RNA methylase
MNFEKTLLQIKNFRVSEEIEDYDVSEFFDVVIEELPDVNLLTKRQQEQLIKTLFEFLKIQDPEMNENF